MYRETESPKKAKFKCLGSADSGVMLAIPDVLKGLPNTNLGGHDVTLPWLAVD